MELNKRVLIPVLVMLVISWTGNIIYYNNHKLMEPLFLKHYYDIKTGMPYFQLYYVNNIGSDGDVADITFPEIGLEHVSFDKTDMNNDGKYYKMCMMNVMINRGDAESIPENLKNKIITKAHIQLTNGDMMDVDLGKIYLYSGEPGRGVLKVSRGMASNDNSGSTSFEIAKYTKINEVTSKFPELVSDIVEVDINGKSLKDISFPIELEMGSNLDVNYSFNFKKDDIRSNNVYNFSLDLMAEDRMGNKSPGYVLLNYYKQSPEQLDIKALKKDRGY